MQDQGFAPRDSHGTQRVDGGRTGQHQAGPLLEGDRRWLGHQRFDRDEHAVGVGPRGMEGDDLVTNMDRARGPFGTVAVGTVAANCEHHP